MILRQAITDIFLQLCDTLQKLSDKEYNAQSTQLSKATIGQHIRHIVELFQCLEEGLEAGIVNYEKRKRDYRIESDRILAIETMKTILHGIKKTNQELLLEAEDYSTSECIVSIPTNYYRELVYNLEHAIHHMALIRVGINELSSIQLPASFGVAYSTLKFREQCAQ